MLTQRSDLIPGFNETYCPIDDIGPDFISQLLQRSPDNSEKY